MDGKAQSELRDRIIFSILNEEMRRTRTRLYALYSSAVIGFFGVIFGMQNALTALAQSGFYEYARIPLSDTDIVSDYWQEMTLSLVDALPLMAITTALFAVVVFLGALRFIACTTENTRVFSLRSV